MREPLGWNDLLFTYEDQDETQTDGTSKWCA